MTELQKGVCWKDAWSHGDPASGGYVTTYFVLVVGEERGNWWRRLRKRKPRWTVMVWDINFRRTWQLMAVDHIPETAEVVEPMDPEHLLNLIFFREDAHDTVLG